MSKVALLLVALAGTASAADPTAWRLARVTHAARDGLTRFEVLQADEHGGRVRIIRSPRDESCPGGATYVMSWRIDGESRRVALGQGLLVSFEGNQTHGERCPNGEPLARAATGLGKIDPGWAPGSYLGFEGPGYREFYLHPEVEGIRDRHLGQWQVSVPRNAHQPHLFLSIGIDTSGASGGQYFNYAILYDAEPPGAPPLPPPTAPKPDPILTPYPEAPAAASGLERGMNRYGSDYRWIDLASGRAEECRAACAAEPQCRAFTLVRAGVQGPSARCWLKSAVPPLTADPNCVSGVVPREPATAPPPAAPPPPPAAPPAPAFAINPAWLTTYYYKSSYYGMSYTLTLTAPGGVLDGRIRTQGAYSDPRRLYNFRLVEKDVLVGEWESDPVFDNPAEGKRGRGRGTFNAGFYPSSGKTFYIMFKVGPGNEMEAITAEMANSWYREPY